MELGEKAEMSTTAQLLTVLLFGWLTCGGEALIDRLYCGKNNCYDCKTKDPFI